MYHNNCTGLTIGTRTTGTRFQKNFSVSKRLFFLRNLKSSPLFVCYKSMFSGLFVVFVVVLFLSNFASLTSVSNYGELKTVFAIR